LSQCIGEHGERACDIAALSPCVLDSGGGFGKAKGADRPGRALQRVRERAGLGWHLRQCINEAASLLEKHPQHLALERLVVERHAPEMVEIQRASGGSRQRGWHPGGPSQSLKFRIKPNAPAFSLAINRWCRARSKTWLMERLKYLPSIRRH